MGPRKAAEIFLAKHPEAKSFEVTLYGSLAATGKGHMTDQAILEVLGEEREVAVTREISKMFEETVRGTLAEVADHFRQHAPKGEFVIVVAGLSTKKTNRDEDEE